MAQMTVQTAALYGIGRGIPADAQLVARALFDRELAIDLGARHLATCYDRAGRDWLGALICYNSGQVHPEGDWWWNRYRGNITRYQGSIVWAVATVGDS